MRIMLTFVSGVVVGYILYGRKDQTIEQLVDTAYSGLEKVDKGIRTRVMNIND